MNMKKSELKQIINDVITEDRTITKMIRPSDFNGAKIKQIYFTPRTNGVAGWVVATNMGDFIITKDGKFSDYGD